MLRGVFVYVLLKVYGSKKYDELYKNILNDFKIRV